MCKTNLLNYCTPNRKLLHFDDKEKDILCMNYFLKKCPDVQKVVFSDLAHFSGQTYINTKYSCPPLTLTLMLVVF